MGIQILIFNQILTPENPHQGLCLLLEEEQSYGGVSSNLVLLIPPYSTMEAEYVAACEAAKEAVWLRQFFIDLKVVPSANK